MLIVIVGAATQYYQSKQLMPQSKDARSLRSILKEAGQGKSADQQEVGVAMGRWMLYLIPGFVFIFGLNFPAALPLYWLTNSLVAVIQQGRVLKEDETEALALADKATVTVTEDKPAKRSKSKAHRKHKKRKR